MPRRRKRKGDEEKPALRTRESRKQLAEVVDTSVDGEMWMRVLGELPSHSH